VSAVAGVGRPTELDPWLVLLAVEAALHAGTGLRSMDDELLGDRNVPAPIQHRRFRFYADQILGSIPQKARPGDVLLAVEKVQVVIVHDLDPGSHRASYALASEDVVRALRALLTRTELSGLGQPTVTGVRRQRRGTTIEHTIALEVQYHLTLPAAE
jgi:hypothetical protein